MENTKKTGSAGKTAGIILNIVLWLFVAFCVAVTVIAFSSSGNANGIPSVGGRCFLNVQSGSMDAAKPDGVPSDKPDGFPTEAMIVGDYIADSAAAIDALESGDVITFRWDIDGNGRHEPGEYNTHRIVSMERDASGALLRVRTQGDNPEYSHGLTETVDRSAILARYTGVKMAGLGSVLSFLSTQVGFGLCILLPMFLFFVYEAVCFARAVRAVRLAGCDGERFSVSIGGTLCRGEPVEEAVSRADAMMYRAKEKKDAVVTGQGTAGPVKTRKKPLVLVADDAPDDREQLRECLSEEFSVLTADEGDACIRALEQYGTAVSPVLLDLIMPTPDGFDVLEYMAEHRLLEDIPVIIVTGDENDALLGSAYEMGVTDYLNRPFDAHTVRRRVRNTVRLYAKQRRLLSMVSTQLTARDKNARFLVDLLAEVEGYRCGTDRRTHARIAPSPAICRQRTAAIILTAGT